jgi:hypothetical protein
MPRKVTLTPEDEHNITSAVMIAAHSFDDPSHLLKTLEKLSPTCRQSADQIRDLLAGREPSGSDVLVLRKQRGVRPWLARARMGRTRLNVRAR